MFSYSRTYPYTFIKKCTKRECVYTALHISQNHPPKPHRRVGCHLAHTNHQQMCFFPGRKIIPTGISSDAFEEKKKFQLILSCWLTQRGISFGLLPVTGPRNKTKDTPIIKGSFDLEVSQKSITMGFQIPPILAIVGLACAGEGLLFQIIGVATTGWLTISSFNQTPTWDCGSTVCCTPVGIYLQCPKRVSKTNSCSSSNKLMVVVVPALIYL